MRVFDLLDTKEVVALTPTCRYFHCLVLRLIHDRLRIAAGLGGHTLYLECHHPAARTPAGKLFCDTLDTEGLQDLLAAIHDDENYLGQVKQVFALYTRFKPQRREQENTVRFSVPGDIPGSRTHPSSNPPEAPVVPNEAVLRTVTVDAHEIFSQLSTLAYLGRREVTRGVMFSIQQVGEGHIRIWRDWLAKQCESKRWTDGEPIAIHHDPPASPTVKGKGRSDSVTSSLPPSKDPSILWVDSRDENVGIKFRVKERVWQRNTPISYSSEIEASVSYVVELEGALQERCVVRQSIVNTKSEIIVRTSTLVLKLEEAQELVATQTGKVIVFGSYRG